MKTVFIVLILSFFIGCSGAKKTVTLSEGTVSESSERYDESFDPTTLEDDDIEITRDEGSVNNTEQKIGNRLPESPVKTSKSSDADGWRVQILATKNIETATLVHQKASDQFALSDFKAYLIFEAPLYKVRVGDATDRNDAEVIRELARAHGYAEAFIVRSKIAVVQDSIQFQP